MSPPAAPGALCIKPGALTYLPDRETEAHISCLSCASRTRQTGLHYPSQDGEDEDSWGEDSWVAWDGGAKPLPSMRLSWGLWAALGFAELARGSTGAQGWVGVGSHAALCQGQQGESCRPGKMPPWHQSPALHAPCLSFPTGETALARSCWVALRHSAQLSLNQLNATAGLGPAHPVPLAAAARPAMPGRVLS